MSEQITNARRGGAGVLVEVDEQVDSQGRRYPVAIVRASDGGLRALHFSEPGQIRALAQAEPRIGDRLSLSGASLHVDRPDLYGPATQPEPAANWARWANVAYRRDPESPSHLVPDPVAPAAAALAPRVRREIKMPNGQIGFTYDPEPARSSGQVVDARDGRGLEVRR